MKRENGIFHCGNCASYRATYSVDNNVLIAGGVQLALLHERHQRDADLGRAVRALRPTL